MNIRINRLQHVGIPVADLNESCAFYERLGFANVMETSFPYEGKEGKVAMMKRDEMVMELYQMPEPELSRVKQRADGRIDHIAFDVDDIDEAFESVKAAGFTLLHDEPVFLSFWDNGCKYFYISGPNGERLEFCQVL